MFFKKVKTNVDDDYNDDDDWLDSEDDFDLDGGGFNDNTPKSGVRQVVTEVRGSFFKGIKDSLLSPTTHKKILGSVMPDGYVAAYDDARAAITSTKGLYDTVKKEAQETHDTYLNELAPYMVKYDEKKQSKLSGKLARYAAKARRGTPSNQISEDELAYTAASNEIFGTALQKQSTEAMSGMAASFQESSSLARHSAERQTDIMVNQTNALNKSNAFNEQVALKFKQKSLELQFKHYFTARKQLEVNNQQLEYLQATIPNIVKNTGLPDAVKINLTEQAGLMFKSKLIGNTQDFAGKQLTSTFGDLTGKLGEIVTNKLNTVRSNAGMVTGGLDMLSGGGDEFGTSPTDLILDMLGGFAGDFVVNKAIDKSKDYLRERVNNSNIDAEGKLQQFNMMKSYLLPTLKQTLSKGGTGNARIDDFIYNNNLQSLVPDRDNTLQKNLSDHLADQALFDLETKKSITSTIPGLLSEIHGEISTMRNGMGMPEPDKDGKLKMDWDTGFLNTRGNIKTKLSEKIFNTQTKNNALDDTYKLLESLGFDTSNIKETNELRDKDDNLVLDSKGLNAFAKYMKTKSFDANNTILDTVGLAKGDSAIADEEARAAIAKMFKDLGVDTNQTLLADGQEPFQDLLDRISNQDARQNEIQSKVQAALHKVAASGFEYDKQLKAIATGNSEELLELGAAGMRKDGSIGFDAKAFVDNSFAASDQQSLTSSLNRASINNTRGAQTRVMSRDIAARSRAKKDAEKKRVEVARASFIRKLKDEGRLSGNDWRDAVSRISSGDFSYLEGELSDAERAILFPVTAKPGTTQYYRQMTRRKHLRDNVTDEEVETIKTDAPPVTETSGSGILPDALKGQSTYKPTLKLTPSQVRASTLVPLGGSATGDASGPPSPDGKVKHKPRIYVDTVMGGPRSPPPPTDGRLALRFNQPDGFAGDRSPSQADKTFDWSNFLSDHMKILFDKIIGGFKPIDFVNMAEGVIEGVKGFLTTIADKGKAANPRSPQGEHLLLDEVTRNYGGDPLDDTASLLSHFLDQLSDYWNNDGPTENHFFGGKVGGGLSGVINHFRRGGKVKSNKKQAKALKGLDDAKAKIDNSFKNLQFKSGSRLSAPLMDAMRREKQLGGDPQVIVASTGEHVLSTANGDAQAFEQLQKAGLWNKIKANANNLIEAKENDGDLKGKFKNLGREIKTAVPKQIENGKKHIKEDIDKVKNGLDTHGTSTALLIRDIRGALGNEEVMGLSVDDIKLTEQMKAVAGEVSDIIGVKLGGGKESVKEFWGNFEKKCQTEGTTLNKALNDLKSIKQKAQDGKLAPIFKYIESKDIKSKLDKGLSKLKNMANLDALKDQDGKYSKALVKDYAKDRAGAIKDTALNAKSAVGSAIQNFDYDEAKANLSHKALKAQYKAEELKDKAKDKFSSLKGKASGMFYDEQGNPIFDSSMFNKIKDMKLPALNLANKQTEALATISRQMSELIRTNALIAIGTGTSSSDAMPSDPSSIAPFAIEKKTGANVKTAWAKLKGKFGSKEEDPTLDEDGQPIENKTRFSKFKAWMKRKSSIKALDPNAPKIAKKQGNKIVSVKASLGQWLKNRKLAGAADGNANKQFKDIYIKGQKDAVITGLELSKGLYTKADGQVINSIFDIEGAILDLSGKVIISQEEFDAGRVIFKNAKGINDKKLFNKTGGLVRRVKDKFSFFSKKEGSVDAGSTKNKYINSKWNIAADIYIRGAAKDDQPILTKKGFENGEYFTQEGDTIKLICDIDGAIFDKDGNEIVSLEDVATGKLVLRTNEKVQIKKKGLIRRLFGLGWSVTAGAHKLGWATTKALVKPAWALAKVPFKGAMWSAKKIFGINMAEDVYVIGEEEPALLAKKMKKGEYLDKETGKPITCFKDIIGAVVDSDGNTVITKEEFENKKLLTRSGAQKKSLASTVTGGMFGLMQSSSNLTFRIFSKPFRMLLDNKGKKIRKDKSEFILFDIYVKDNDKPVILAKEVPNNIYFDNDGKPVTKYSQLDKPVYDKDKNILISEEDIQKGLVTYDGTPIGKIGKGLFKGGLKTIGFGFGAVGGIFKGLLSLTAGSMKLLGGTFSFSTKVGKKLFGALNNGFNVDGRDKYALMIQAQAASVDKLEAIRLLLEQNIVKKKKFNDADGDGVRDGSYLDQLRNKAKNKDKDEDDKDDSKKDGKENKKEGSSLLDAMNSPITKLIAGGLLYSFGPQLMKALKLSVQSSLPNWLGGLSDERKAEIEQNGGIFATAIKEGKSHKKGDATNQKDDPNTEKDESVYQEDQKGTSLLSKLAMGYVGYKGASAALKYGVKKAGGWALKRAGLMAAGTTAGTLAGATGAAGAGLAGAAGAGTVAAATGAAGTATAAIAGGTALEAAALGTGAAVTGAATVGSGAGFMAGLAGLGGAAGAALASPIGLFVLGGIAVAATAYGGYKLYKYLTKEDSHLAEWRMTQYGYKIDDKDHVTKILDLEAYLDKCTTKATNTQNAKINGQADLNKALKIFGISNSNSGDVNKFSNWFHYRFKLVYLTWKTVLFRLIGDDNLAKVDQNLLKADKLSVISSVSMGQYGAKLYDVIDSPFPGEKQVTLSEGQVSSKKEAIISAIQRLDAAKHDDKILKNGGGKNKTVSSVEENKRIKDTKASNSATGNASNLSGSTPTNNTPKQDKPVEDTQSWWKKILYGDKTTEEEAKLSKPGMLANAMDSIGDFITGSGGKAAANTIEFAKSFTKGLKIGNLTEAQTAALAANTAETESHFDMDITNKYGYAGLYQFGGEALADIGFMKKIGGGWKAQNAAMQNDSNWNNGLSLKKYLSSRQLQDQAYVALVNNNLKYGRSGAGAEAAKFDQMMGNYQMVAKYAKMAHLKGPRNAINGLLHGQDSKDGTGTSMIKYGDGAAAAVGSILAGMGAANATPAKPKDAGVISKVTDSVKGAATSVYNKIAGITPAAASLVPESNLTSSFSAAGVESSTGTGNIFSNFMSSGSDTSTNNKYTAGVGYTINNTSGINTALPVDEFKRKGNYEDDNPFASKLTAVSNNLTFSHISKSPFSLPKTQSSNVSVPYSNSSENAVKHPDGYYVAAKPYKLGIVYPQFNECKNVVPYPGTKGVAAGMKSPLDQLIVAAKKDNIKLVPISGFRSIAYQRSIVDNKRKKGLSDKAIYSQSSEPGFSEHHTGYAVDFNSLNPGFANSKEYAWLISNGAKYGFYQTYTAEYCAKSGVSVEPWHWKFVGTNEAKTALTPVGGTIPVGGSLNFKINMPIILNGTGAGNGQNIMGDRIAAAAESLLGNTLNNYTEYCGRGTITILRKAGVPGLTPYTGNSSKSKDWPSAGADAKELGPTVEKLGWKEIPSNDSPRNGDIDILGPNKLKGDSHAGHIQVYANGYWYSDTKQSARLRDAYSWVKFYRRPDAGASSSDVGSTSAATGASGTSGASGSTASPVDTNKTHYKTNFGLREATRSDGRYTYKKDTPTSTNTTNASSFINNIGLGGMAGNTFTSGSSVIENTLPKNIGDIKDSYSSIPRVSSFASNFNGNDKYSNIFTGKPNTDFIPNVNTSVKPVEVNNYNVTDDDNPFASNFVGNSSTNDNPASEFNTKAGVVDTLARQKQLEQASVQQQIKQQQTHVETAQIALDVMSQQLAVQKQISKDIAEMVKVMKSAPQYTPQVTTPTVSGNATTNQKPAEQNRHTKTIDKLEPVSMKIH